eukprot:TRINITY_DN2153_c0_g1_i2.p2 TRINITY_DN2153_c0_g1~~TRINITY_DN2153_c0_g1_i2.p2  ORF type:complete len:52 (-),score=4.03 TRINITY_DN2153_c0_g1_i2:129-284(-)
MFKCLLEAIKENAFIVEILLFTGSFDRQGPFDISDWEGNKELNEILERNKS